MKYCKNCGYPADSDDQEYCMECGTPFDDVPAKPGPYDPTHGSQPGGDEPPLPKWIRSLVNFVNSKAGKTVIAVAVLLLLVAVFVSRPRPDPTPTPTPTSTPSNTAEPDFTEAPTVEPDLPVGTELAGLTVPGEHTAAPTGDTVILRNALPDGIITVDGKSVPFGYEGADAIVNRSNIPDFCIIRIIAPYHGKYASAAVCYNVDYGNDMILGSTEEDGTNNYGAYRVCDQSGYTEPNDKFVNILTWDFFKYYQKAVNEQNSGMLRYVTSDLWGEMSNDVQYDAGLTYDLRDFVGVADTNSIHTEANVDGTVSVLVNAHFKGNVTYMDGREDINEHYYTLRMVWEDGMWQISDRHEITAADYSSGYLARLS